MAEPSFSIIRVEDRKDLESTIKLFEAYAHSLGIDLAFQDFATEMANMPGKYSAPTGALLLARDREGQAIGCVGLRPLTLPDYCEIKRLYVDPKGRGLGVGKALSESAILEGKRLGYKAVRLDTLPSMVSARALYKSLGFEEIAAYYSTPLEGTIFLERVLESRED